MNEQHACVRGISLSLAAIEVAISKAPEYILSFPLKAKQLIP